MGELHVNMNITLDGVIRRPPSLDGDSMPLVAETIEPDLR